jgi:hypothetical protein
MQKDPEAEAVESTQGTGASGGPKLQGCISTSTPLGPQVQLDASGTLIFREAGAATTRAMYEWQAILPDATRVCGRHDGSYQMFLPDGSTCKHQTIASDGDASSSWVASMQDGEQFERFDTAPETHAKQFESEGFKSCDRHVGEASQV